MPLKEANLKMIQTLKKFKCNVGYSGHESSFEFLHLYLTINIPT